MSVVIKLFLMVIGIYVLGITVYWVSKSWFRRLVLGLSWILAPLFLLFTIIVISISGEGGLGVGVLYLYVAPFGVFFLGQICAHSSHIASRARTDKPSQKLGVILIILAPPAIFSWLVLALPSMKQDRKIDQFNNMRQNGVFDFYFADRKFEFPCHDALFSFYGHSRHGGEDICRLKKDVTSEQQIRKKLYIKHRDSGEYYFCEKNGSPKRRESAYCQFKRPELLLIFSEGVPEWSSRELKAHGVTSNSPPSMIGGLKLIHKSVKQREPMKRRTDGAIVQRRPITKLMFSKVWTKETKGFQHKAYIMCSEGWSYEGTYSCSGKLQIGKNVQVNLRYEVSEIDIENQLDNRRDEIWNYWLYLDKNFRVWPPKTSN